MLQARKGQYGDDRWMENVAEFFDEGERHAPTANFLPGDVVEYRGGEYTVVRAGKKTLTLCAGRHVVRAYPEDVEIVR